MTMPGRSVAGATGLGCLGILLLVVVGYILSVLWWSFWLMHATHWAGAENWTYWYTCTHWGALTPFVAG